MYSSYNNISNNIIGQNFFGLLVERSSYNIILNNKFIEDGIGFTAGTNLHKKSYYNHVIKGNTVNDKPLYYYKQKNDFIVPQDAGQIILFNCDNVMIENQHIEYGDVAILLAYCDSCTIQKSLFSNNLSIGVVMINSHYNIIRENNISNNEVVQYSIGIYTDYCNNTIYKDNYIANNNWGLSLMNSHYCTIENNNFIDNEGYGVALFTSTYIKILNNSVIGDTSRGFSLDTVGMTEITNNTISLNYGNKIAGWGCMGIWVLPYGWGIRIKENHISKCQTGILIETSYNNHVENNYITDCRIAGSSQLSNRDIIEAFLPKEKLIEPLAAIPSKGCGIYIFNSGTNWIKYNSVKENQIGIVLIRSTRNDIRLNNIEDSLTGFELISFLSTGYYPLNFWGSSITGPLFKSNKFLVLIPWSPIRISQAP